MFKYVTYVDLNFCANQTQSKLKYCSGLNNFWLLLVFVFIGQWGSEEEGHAPGYFRYWTFNVCLPQSWSSNKPLLQNKDSRNLGYLKPDIVHF